MHRSILLAFVIFMSIMLHGQVQEPESESTYRHGEMLVLLHQNSDINQLVAGNSAIGLKALKRISPAINMWIVTYDTTITDGEKAKELLSHNKAVQIVQFNHNNIVQKNNAPNDSLYSRQWDMDIISGPEAWALDTGGVTTGGRSIVVASIDGGFDISHPDLHAWHNANEIPGNGIDDDNNGYVDDYNGWNSTLSNDSITLDSHGTATMGISSAHGNNTIGISGVCWDVTAMPITTSIYNESTVIAAYSYAFTQRKLYNQTNGVKGAFIVSTNSSFGPSGYGYQYPLWNAMYDSMGSVGILSAGATSNDPNCNTDSCPDIPSQCASRYTIIATGTTSADVRHGGYGLLNVDIAAPGNGSFTIYEGGGYGGFGGTSAASPHIAGAVALMWSAACPKMLDDYTHYPDSMALVMKRYLLAGVDTLPALVGKIASGGRLNLLKAVNNVMAYDCQVSAGVNDISEDGITLYPNPSASTITIKSNIQIRSAQLYDYLGRALDTRLNGDSISIQNIPSGIYGLEITDASGNTWFKRLVRK